MPCGSRRAKINVKVLVILVVVVAVLAGGLFAARQVRRGILSKRDLAAGEAAFAKGDYAAASKYYQEYLGRHPDDIEIMRKYAHSRLSIRPLEGPNILQAIAGYRRIMQLNPQDQAACEKLATLYIGIGNFEELTYIARMRLEREPKDLQARLWLSEGLIQLNKHKEARLELEAFVTELLTLPDKHVECVRALSLLSHLETEEGADDARAKAHEWLNKAVGYDPASAEALMYRARFYRQSPEVPGVADPLAAARKDLEAADALNADNPRVRLFLANEWLALDDLDRAEAELEVCEKAPLDVLEKEYLDIQTWIVAKFQVRSQLTMAGGTSAEQGALADETLGLLTEGRHRSQVLPSVVQLYCRAGRASDAKKYLDEYLDLRHSQAGAGDSQSTLAFLRALVAQAEDNAYAVIDALLPVTVSHASHPDLWRLLSDAYGRTDQTRRAVNALVNYLRLRPHDPQMTLQLAKEYLKLHDWNKAFETARMAEPLDPTDVILRLLRIEASIQIAVEQSQQRVDQTRLADLSAELAELRQKHPERVDVRILQAVIATYLDRPDEAERELKLAIEECEEPLRAEMQLVRHYYRTNRLAEAIDACSKSCEKHPELAEPWLSLSGLHVANADHDSARDCLRKGLNGVVGKWEKRSVTVRLALLELMQGDRSAGTGLLSDLAAQDEHEVYVRTLLLGVREVQQDRPRAQKLVDELRKAEGESGLSWRHYQALLWLGSDDWRSRQQEIRDHLQYCVDADPDWSAPALLLMDMYERLNESKRVEDLCRQALARNPSATEIADKLVTLLEKQGRFSDAEQVLRQVEADSRVASAWNVRSALRAGDFSRAIDELKLRVSNDKQDVNSRILLARLIYWQTRDAGQAFPYLDQAERITTDSMASTAVRVAILKAEGRTEEAQKILDSRVADRGDFESYMMRGAYFANEQDIERAEEDYRKLTTFADSGIVGYEMLSTLYGRNGRLDAAISVLEEGVKAHPDDLRLKRRLMRTLFLPGDAQDRPRAFAMLEELRKQLPRDPELMKILAVQTLQDDATPQSIAAARSLLDEAVALEPTAVDGHLTLINLAMAQGQAQVARDCAIRALGSNPNDPSLLVARGRAELAMDNTQMAVELTQLVLGKDPNNAAAIDLLVTASLNSRDASLLDRAKTLLDSRLARDAGNEPLLLQWAHVMTQLKQPQTAIPRVTAYCQSPQGSGSVRAVVTLADLHRISGNPQEAERILKEASQSHPDDLAVIHAHCVLLVSQKRYDQLEGVSARYLAAKNPDPAVLTTAGTLMALLEPRSLKEEGVKLFERAVELAPTSVDAGAGLASTLYQLGDADRAKKIYGELVEQHPTNRRLLNDLAWILQERDHDYVKALELADKGLLLAPTDLNLLDTRGTILANMPERLADAKKDFEKLASLAPADSARKAKALLQLGRVCAKLNDSAAVRQHLANALAADRQVNVFSADEKAEIQRLLESAGAK